MTDFIKTPHLPEGRVSMAICSQLPPELVDFLRGRGVELIFGEANPDIDPAVSGHIDMAAVHIGGKNIVLDCRQIALAHELKSIGMDISLSSRPCQGAYPGDIGLNCAIVGREVFANLKAADERLLQQEKFHFHYVKQGYAGCSVLPISERSIITDDSSIAMAAEKVGISVLLIEKGDIALPGHKYGFIGGASTKISKDEVLFFGDITAHRSWQRIKDFLEKNSCRPQYFDFPLTDCGGIIPIMEHI